MITIDLCLRVKPSGSKCSVLLHILVLALNPLKQTCSLAVPSLFTCLHPIPMQWPCLLMFLSFFPPAFTHANVHFYILLSSLFFFYPPFFFPQTARILYSNKNSPSCSSAHHVMTAGSGSVTAPHPKTLQQPQHLQTAFCLTGYKSVSDPMSAFQRAGGKRKYFNLCLCIIKEENNVEVEIR